MSATATRFRCSSPLPYLKKFPLMFLTLILQYLKKLIEGKVGDFTSPKPFHTAKVQRLKDDGIKLLAKFRGELPMKVFALIADFPIEVCNLSHTPRPAVRTFDFTRKAFVERPKLLQGLFQELWVLYLLTRVEREKSVFHAEVCPNTLTRCWQRFRFYKVGDEIKPIITTSVAFYRETVDIPVKLAVLVKCISHFIMSPFTFIPFSEIESEAIVFQRPTRLFQRQGLEPMPFLNLRSAAKFLEKTLIGKVYPFQLFLHRLTRQGFPMWVCGAFQHGQVFAHRSIVGIRQAVFIALALPLVKIRVNLPHIVKQVAKTNTIRLFTDFIFVGFHGLSGIRHLSLYSGRQTRYQVVTLYMSANLI